MTATVQSAAPVRVDPVGPASDERKWVRCGGCGTALYVPQLRRGLGVCPLCGHHHRLRPAERIGHLLDPGSFRSGAAVTGDADVLGFVDRRPYRERLAEARQRVGPEAAVWGTGRIAGQLIVVVVMDFAFLGGSMGATVGETVTLAAERALRSRIPLLVVAASGGARMQEGCVSLMQMAKTAQAFGRLREAGIFSVCVLTDPTFGGVTASFAGLADILIAESGALIGFAGPRVVEQATRSPLPEGFQRADYLLSHGLVDRVEHRRALRSRLAQLLRMHRAATPAAIEPDGTPIVRDPAALADQAAWATLRCARDPRRPTTLDYARLGCDEFVELHGDRLYGDDPAVVGGLASIAGLPVMLIGHQKGHTTAELVARNFGVAHPEGYRKALRLMRLADRLGLPTVTLVDTPGAAAGSDAEARGQAWAIAESIAGMAALNTPVVAVVTGEGGSGGALALAVANRVLAMSNACYSVISPESCSTILFGGPDKARDMSEALRITGPHLLRMGVVDGVVPEPEGGSQAGWRTAATALRAAIMQELAALRHLGPERLREQRSARFRGMGTCRAAAGDD